MLGLFDTHCHLQSDDFQEDLSGVIAEAQANGVGQFLVPAIGLDSFEKTLVIAAQPNIYCALGIHPHNASEWSKEVRETILHTIANNSKVRAIGEIGIDYHYDFAPKPVQRTAFEEQILLAKAVKLPIIVHIRESDEDVYEILERHYSGSEAGPTGQLHCFSGSVESMHRGLALGFYISFTGNITFKKSTLSDVVIETPLDKILLETDSPYLAPVPFRGKRNTPSNVGLVAQKVAELKGLSISEVISATTANAKRLFLPMLFLVLSLATTSNGFAQAGSKPPDSIMTIENRKANEARQRQLEEISQQKEQRRLDSIQQAQDQQQEILQRIRQQAINDSLEAVRRVEEADRERIKALTPVPWKAIGIGGGIGIVNLEENQAKPSITPTSTLATTFQIGSQLTRIIDVQLSYTRSKVDDDISNLNLYRDSLYAPTGVLGGGRPARPGDILPIYERFDISVTGFDVRFLITPKTAFKFYAGLGYSHLNLASTQRYHLALDTTAGHQTYGQDQEIHDEFSRGSIKLLFGARYDIELNDQFTLTPFAEISALGAFNGEGQRMPYTLRPDPEQITLTHLEVGASIYFGWFGVKRQ